MRSTRDRYGRWALVAGASEGLGAAFAEALARRGHDLVLLARRAEVLEAVAAGLRTDGREVVTASVDLSDPELPARLAAVIGDREIGVAVYNAAWAPVGPVLGQTLETQLRAIDVNCRGPLVLLGAVLPGMVARKRGGVVLMSSLTAFQGSPYTTVYGATKAFNLALGEGLWGELAEHGIDVLACAAGATRTPGYLRASGGGAPGELDPAQVAEEALDGLGGGGLVIPGAFNRFASFLMRRVLPRAMAVRIMRDQTRKLSGPGE